MSLLLPPSSLRAPICVAELAADRAVLGSWLHAHGRLWAGMDGKAAASVLLGGVSSEVLETVLASDGAKVWPGPGEVWLDLTWATWVDGTTTTPVLTYRVEISGGTDDGRSSPAQAIAALHGPLVAALAEASGLGTGALWRIVTDCVAQACLDAGRRRGDAAAGMELARTILGDQASPLFNRQWHFFEIEAPRRDGRSVREWFRSRGGCCRYYTTSGGFTCSTCVLRDPATRDAILRDWLATRAEAA